MTPARTAVPVLALAAHKLRAGWRGWATLAVLVALAGGTVLAAVAGAIRTDTAYPRFLAASNASDALVAPAGPGTGGYDAAVAKLPGVAVAAPVVGINAAPVSASGVADNSATVVAPLDGRFSRALEIPKMLAGRLPAASAPREIAVSQTGAQQLHLRVGSTLRMAALDNSTPPRARPLTEQVVGVFVTAGSVLPVNYLDQVAQFIAPLALYRELGPDYEAFDGTYVKLKPGASMPVFSARAQDLAKRYPATGKQAFVADQSAQAATVERAIRPQAVALALFALALALTALLVVGQVAARLLIEAAGDNTALAALGMTRRQMIAVGLAEVTAAAVAGAAGAVIIAIGASPLMPIGPARLAEPSPGVSVDGPVLAAGFAVIVVLLLARVTVTAWRQAAARPAGAGGDADAARLPGAQAPRRRSRVAERLAAAGAPPQAVSGLRLALDPGRGGTGVPARSALLGLAVAVGVVAVTVTFGANLLRLVDTPRLYGQAWDVAFDGQFGTVTPRQFNQVTGNVPGISDVTFGVHGTVSIEGPGGDSAPADPSAVIPAIGLAAGTGPLMSPTVLDGRPPRTAGEIVLGTSVLRQLGLRVGERVTVNTPSGKRPMLITGSAVFPYFGQGSFTPTDVGEGAETTASVLAPQAAASNGGQPGYNFALMSFTPGPAKQADIAALQRRWAPFCAQIEQSTCLVTDLRPNTVNNYAAIDGTPAVLAAVLGVLGLAVLAQFTIASARRSRRDYAILKVLGMTRRDLRAVTFCQAATVTAGALIVGIPLGIAGGRWAWQLFAGQAGLPPDTITPLQVLWMVPATVAVALLVASPAARSVARTPASGTLRAE
jgi:ABC-type lipoprotein release transport system permease subunit